MNFYEFYIKVESMLKPVIAKISIYLKDDYQIEAINSDIVEKSIMSLYLELQKGHYMF